MKFRTTEHDEQVAVVEWARYAQKLYPALRLLHATPNGGLRHIITARKLKAEGVKAGVPDLLLPVARDGQHGLWIEMKTKGGKISATQTWWLAELEKEGYQVAVCYSAHEAIGVIKKYLFPLVALDKSPPRA